MTAMLLHTMLAVVLIAWTYAVATRVPYHPAWLWTGTGVLVVVGYLALIARYVFEGSPAKVQGAVAVVGGTAVALAGVACLLLFAVVSRAVGRPSGGSRIGGRSSRRGRRHTEEHVIIPEGVEEGGTPGLEPRGLPGPSGVRSGDGRAGPRRAFEPTDTDR